MVISKSEKKKTVVLAKDNRGISFVELLIAMVLLLIILGPVMKAVIAGLEVNRNSRKMMCATDAAQGVMEGISGKSYKGLLNSYNPAFTKLTGYNELARVGGSNIYNENMIKTHGCIAGGFNIQNVTYNGFRLDGTDYVNKDLALLSTSTDVSNSNTILQTFGNYGLSLLSDPANQVLVMHGDNASATAHTDAKVIFFAYYNIPWQGYTFDAVGYVLPATTLPNPNFYPCVVRVAIYEVKSDGTHTIATNSDPILSINDGLRNR